MRRYPPEESAREHCRNALALVRLMLEAGEVTFGNQGRGIIVPVDVLGAIQARLEAAIEKLEPPTGILDFPQRPEE